MARKRAYPENILHDLQVEGVTEDVLYYVENKLTRKEIAAEFDVTEERLRQIIRRALRRIRVRANIKITKKI